MFKIKKMVGITIKKDLLINRSVLFELLDNYPLTIELKHGKNKAIKNKDLVQVYVYYTVSGKLASDLKSIILGGEELNHSVKHSFVVTNIISIKYLRELVDKRKTNPEWLINILNVLSQIDNKYNIRKK